MLVLSDVEGVLDDSETVIGEIKRSEVTNIQRKIAVRGGDRPSPGAALGTGGMYEKLGCVSHAPENTTVVIANAKTPGIVRRVIREKDRGQGTWIVPG